MSYNIVDPRPLQAAAPYTFYLPSEAALAHLAPGDLVKLMIASTSPDPTYEAERMWVILTERTGDTFTGLLDNQPEDIPGLALGDRLRFAAHTVLDIIWDTPETAPDDPDTTSAWLARCLVDSAVIEGRARVGFLFRDPPDTPENADYPDTGWCLRAHEDDVTAVELDAENIVYVALGAVLNHDDSFIDLLEAQPGSAFEKQTNGTFAPVPFEDRDEQDG